MGAHRFPTQLEDVSAFMVGIKGTGMTALTEVLHRAGARVSGSDIAELFYTDAILDRLGVPVHVGFEAEALPADTSIVIYSAAYDPESNPQLIAARHRGIPRFTYPEALGELSRGRPALGVSGVHGKTTTTAMIGSLVKRLGLSGAVLVGSAAADFDGMSTYSGGQEFFVAETCEYRRHFLDYHPDIIIVTSIEPDHLDYYRDYAGYPRRLRHLPRASARGRGAHLLRGRPRRPGGRRGDRRAAAGCEAHSLRSAGERGVRCRARGDAARTDGVPPCRIRGDLRGPRAGRAQRDKRRSRALRDLPARGAELRRRGGCRRP